MEDNKKTEIEGLMDEVRTAKESLEAERAKLEEQKRAFEAQKIETPKTEETKMSEWRNIADAMLEKRAIALGADNANKIGRVEVVNELFKLMVAKKPLLGRARKFVGPNAQTNIPVLNPTIATPAGQKEGKTGVQADTNAKIAAKTMTPYAYISILPVTAEALQFGALDVEKELPGIFADAFADAAQDGMVKGAGAGEVMTGIFNAKGTEVKTKDAHKFTLADLVNLALTVKDKSDNCVIVMNPTIYSAMTATAAEDYRVYKEDLIRNKRVEGVEVILTSYAPNGVADTNCIACALDLNNYAYGVAADLQIEPIKQLGDVNTYYQATMWMNGMPIVAEDVYQLKIKNA